MSSDMGSVPDQKMSPRSNNNEEQIQNNTKQLTAIHRTQQNFANYKWQIPNMQQWAFNRLLSS